jgi:hypothetical protein
LFKFSRLIHQCLLVGTDPFAGSLKATKKAPVMRGALVLSGFFAKLRCSGGLFRGGGGGAVGVAPADFVAFGSGTELALFALGRGFESATAAHFLEDSFGIEFGFEAFESTIDGLAFIEIHSTHAVGWLGCKGCFAKNGAGEMPEWGRIVKEEPERKKLLVGGLQKCQMWRIILPEPTGIACSGSPEG